MSDQKTMYITWWQMYKQIQDLYCLIKNSNYKPDLVIGLARGGLWPAKYIASALDVPFSSLRISRTVSNDPFALKGDAQIIDADFILKTHLTNKKILIVDDITTYGNTIEAAFKYVCSLGAKQIKVATLSSTQIDGEKVFVPDFCLIDNPKNSWMVFPWDIKLNRHDSFLSLFRNTFAIKSNQMNQLVTIGNMNRLRVSNDESFHFEKTYSLPFKNQEDLKKVLKLIEEYLKQEFLLEMKPVIKIYRDTYYTPPRGYRDQSFRLREMYPLNSEKHEDVDSELMIVAVYEDTNRQPILPEFSPEYTEIFLIRGNENPLNKYDVGKLKNIFHFELKSRGVARMAEIEKTRYKYEITNGEDGDVDRTKRPVMRIAFDVIKKIVLPDIIASNAIMNTKVVGSSYLAEVEINEIAGDSGRKFAKDICKILDNVGGKVRYGRKAELIEAERNKVILDPDLTGFVDI